MRKILLLIISAIIITFGMVSKAQTSSQQESYADVPDSTLDVIGFFSKNDTLIYWINQSSWRLSPSDSIKKAGISTKVRLTVVDSTATGYKMDYTFLEVRGDSTKYSSSEQYQAFLSSIVEKLSKKIVGTTIKFETDEFGAITKFNNLGQIKRQAKSLLKETMKELSKIPEIAELDLDLNAVVKNVDTDKLIDGYLEELKLIFLCHGNSYDIGKSHTHEDATETSYENDTYVTVTLDEEDYTYSITIDVTIISFLSSTLFYTGCLTHD